MLAVAAAAAIALVARSSGGEETIAYIGSRPPRGIAAPDFALRDQNGRSVRMRDLRGRAVLLTFLDTRCTDACPIVAVQLGRAYRSLGPAERRQLVMLAISVNPRDDTAPRARAFLERRRASEIHYLLGSEGELRPVWRDYYVLSSLDSGNSDVHSAPVRIFDRDGTWVSTLRPGQDLTAANLAHDARQALRD